MPSGTTWTGYRNTMLREGRQIEKDKHSRTSLTRRFLKDQNKTKTDSSKRSVSRRLPVRQGTENWVGQGKGTRAGNDETERDDTAR